VTTRPAGREIDWTRLKKEWAASLGGRTLPPGLARFLETDTAIGKAHLPELRNRLIFIEERCALETLIWLEQGNAADVDLFLKPLEGAIEIAMQPLGDGDAASRTWLSLTKAAVAPSPGEGRTVLKDLPKAVARTVKDDALAFDCSRTHFVEWLQSQANAMKTCFETIYASPDPYAGRACLCAVFFLMSRMALACELARLRQYWRR